MPPGGSLPKRLAVATAGLVTLLSCGRADEQQYSASTAAQPPVPADSLVATNSEGAQIWFTLLRVDKHADGRPCVERGLEIRQGKIRVKVPLLYTGTIPVFLNDSTVRAILWTNCRPGDSYLVDVRSGQPVRERGRSES